MTKRPKSARDSIESAARGDAFYAAMSGKPARAQGSLEALKPVRTQRRSDPNSPHLEHNIKAAIVKALRKHPEVARVEINVSGIFTGANGNRVMTGSRGKPDLSVFMKSGRYGYIEVKGPTGRLTAIQEQQIDRALKDGAAFAFVARSPEDALLVINCVRD